MPFDKKKMSRQHKRTFEKSHFCGSKSVRKVLREQKGLTSPVSYCNDK